jgi:7-cyano-7-deazaguanine synthase
MSVARRTAILLSGGIDSIALAHWKRPELAITVNYGQVPALAEMDASRAVARDLGLEHEIVSVDCSPIGSGDLAGSTPHDAAPASDWWPYRNQLLITIGAARALACGASRMLIGTVASDHFHADGRPEFIALMADVLRLQEGSLDLEAPAATMSSAELVRMSGVPIEILAWAHSCHKSNFACGRCRGCMKHFEVMQELGIGPY